MRDILRRVLGWKSGGSAVSPSEIDIQRYRVSMETRVYQVDAEARVYRASGKARVYKTEWQ